MRFDTRRQNGVMILIVKIFLLCLGCSCFVTALSSCTTLQNRRDMYYGYEEVNGPYTRMLKEGIPDPENPNVTEIVVTSDYKSVR